MKKKPNYPNLNNLLPPLFQPVINPHPHRFQFLFFHLISFISLYCYICISSSSKMFPILRKSSSIASCFLNDGTITRSISLFRGFSSSKEGDLITSPPPIMDVLLHKYQFPPQSATHCAAILNRLKNPRNAELVLSLFKDYSFSITQLEKLVKTDKTPQLLMSSPESLKLKLEALADLGFPSDDIAQLVSINSSIMLSSSNKRVIPSFSLLKELLGTTEAVIKLCKRVPWLLTSDIESRVVPNMELLETYGVSHERRLKLLCSSPRCLVLNPGIFKENVEKAEEMGAIPSSNMFIYAIRVLSDFSKETWELKWQRIRDCGFSESGIAYMFKKSPQMFSISTKKLRQVKDFLLSSGKYSLSDIVNCPSSLARSIEGRYQPRFKALEMLESRKLIENWPSLAVVSIMTDEKFSERYVDPYLDIVGKCTLQRDDKSNKKENSC